MAAPLAQNRDCDPLDPANRDDADAFTDLMLALLAGARELRRRALKLHDQAEDAHHSVAWVEIAAKLKRANVLDAEADALLCEHQRMLERQWRAEQTPTARARREEVHKTLARKADAPQNGAAP